jgi:hypothetical protein
MRVSKATRVPFSLGPLAGDATLQWLAGLVRQKKLKLEKPPGQAEHPRRPGVAKVMRLFRARKWTREGTINQYRML